MYPFNIYTYRRQAGREEHVRMEGEGMKIVKPAAAGTLESSDILITLKPGDGTLDIQLTSSVDVYYHDTIMQVLKDALEEMEVTSAQVQAVDRGALDCTVRARMITAIKRGSEVES